MPVRLIVGIAFGSHSSKNLLSNPTASLSFFPLINKIKYGIDYTLNFRDNSLF